MTTNGHTPAKDESPIERPTLRQTVLADLTAVARLKGRSRLTLLSALDVIALPGTCAVILFRIGAAFHRRRLTPVSRLCYFMNVVLFGADLAPGAKVGPGLVIGHPVGTGWGNAFTCGRDVVMTGAARFGAAAAEDAGRMGQPTVGDGVIVLDGAKAMGPVSIGDRAVVAANALVLQDMPPDSIIVGQPARVAKMRADRKAPGSPVDPVTSATASVAEVESEPIRS